MPTATFWAEPTGTYYVFLRRYARHDGSDWTCSGGWHQAMVRIEDTARSDVISGDLWPHDDPRWPVECEKGCGYRFTDKDHWQLFHETEMAAKTAAGSIAVGDVFSARTPPPGAMWDASWMPDNWHGPDGIALCAVLPNGHEWLVDARASNCTLPDDDVHKCWVRHGDPRTGVVTVDKNGVTCAAGGGSVWSGQGKPYEYHGFLTNGVFNP